MSILAWIVLGLIAGFVGSKLLLITHGLGFRILLQHQKVSAVQQSRHAA